MNTDNNENKNNDLNHDIIHIKIIVAGIITTIIVYLCFRYILPLIFPFLIAYFLAWIIHPLTDFLCRRLKFTRIIAAIISLGIFLITISVGLYYLIKTVMDQLIMVLRNAPIYIEALSKKLDYICEKLDQMFLLDGGSMRYAMDGQINEMVGHIQSKIMPSITEQSISIFIGFIALIGIVIIIVISTLLIVKDMSVYPKKYQENKFYKQVGQVMKKLSNAGIGYLRAQAVIAFVVAGISIVGLLLIKNEFAFLLGMGIGVFDAFPILGSGLIFIPWSIVMIVQGKAYEAAILFTTYLVCQIIRQVLEPKLIGDRIGINSIYTLMSVYIGICLFSFAGFILGPVALIIITTIVKSIKEKLIST